MNPESEENLSPSSSIVKLLATGLIGWAIGSLLLLGASYLIIKPEVFAIAMMWMITHWWMAFGFGALALIVQGILSRLAVGTALLAYLLPLAVLSAIGGICIAVYPDPGFRSDLLGFMALILIFQALGLIWITLTRSNESGCSNFLRAVLPALIGGIMILGMLSVPVFMSNTFIYRNAFNLTISNTSLVSGAMLSDGVLEIKKPGSYAFYAPRYVYEYGIDPADSGSGVEFGRITWGAAGSPKEGVTGSYPFQIRWEKNLPASLSENDEIETTENQISLEVHVPGKSSDELLYCLSAPMMPSKK